MRMIRAAFNPLAGPALDIAVSGWHEPRDNCGI
jgi:hypothetical protein